MTDQGISFYVHWPSFSDFSITFAPILFSCRYVLSALYNMAPPKQHPMLWKVDAPYKNYRAISQKKAHLIKAYCQNFVSKNRKPIILINFFSDIKYVKGRNNPCMSWTKMLHFRMEALKLNEREIFPPCFSDQYNICNSNVRCIYVPFCYLIT